VIPQKADAVKSIESYQTEIEASPEETWSAVRRAADAWGAEWEPSSLAAVGTGRLRLPVTAGIRHGMLDGELTVEPVVEPVGDEPGEERRHKLSQTTYRTERSVYFVNTRMLVLLLISALGGLMVVIWPFFPEHRELIQIAPLGAVLALVGWFLVISRLENRGAGEFLELVALEAEGPDGSEDGEQSERSAG